jgi:hypothetical protein
VIEAMAQRTFHEAFTSAMRTTLVLPLIVLGIAALSVLLVRGTPGTTPPPEEDKELTPAGAAQAH